MLLNKVLTSISDTYNFTGKPSVIFLNTGDVLNGKFLHNDFTETELLPGQAKKSIKFNDLLYSEIRPVNRHFALVKVNDCDNYVVSTKLMVLRLINSNYSMDYIYQFLSSPRVIDDLQTMAESRSGTFPQITFTELGSIEIPNISLTEQQHIVNILGSIDDKIENLELENKNIVSLSKKIFLTLYNDTRVFNQTKLGSIVSKSNTGADAIQKAPIVDYDTGVKCVRVGDFSNDRNILEWGFCKINKLNYKQYKLCKNDILVTRTATLGLNKFIDEDIDAVYNNGIIRLRINEEKAIPRFIYNVINTNDFYGYISGIEGGSSTRPNMKINYLLDYKFLLPPIKIQKIFDDKYSVLRNKILTNNEKIQHLEKLKQLYLKKFFG